MESGNYELLTSLVLPQGLLDYFTIVKIDQSIDLYQVYLEEYNVKPTEYANERLVSMRFYEEVSVQDFPIRGNKVLLHTHRRRWLNQDTGDEVSRDWNLETKETRMAQKYASLLKELARYASSEH